MKLVEKMSEREMREEITRLRGALSAIKANSAPKAVSLRPRNRINAFYAICCKALEEEG